MTRRMWTSKEILYVRNAALLDTTNQVVNIEKMAKHLKRSKPAVAQRISKLRKEGKLPAYEPTLKIDSKGRQYTEDERKEIIKMYKRQIPMKVIAERFDRTTTAIRGVIDREKSKGSLKSNLPNWDEESEKILIGNIKFDENGYVSNYVELRRLLRKNDVALFKKVSQLRQVGKIDVLPDRTKTSVASKKAHDRFNKARFAHIPKKEEERKEVEKVISQPVVGSQVTSKAVQVILTITKQANGGELHQYFSFEGSLLAEKVVK
ncbi:helix-turn-helix domain containing protein [Vagococcus elongatus]|uniref:Uncharacterized protein n=1 Tax=Vagococcus elongatus TaxID=180344 RepID=A0A430AU61_9ENTE|nr:helix-turn-helix domain containing protein [Vagococcus elongatus]RSU11594.1 hypothetical protein CBF29_07915 [Vagococcus elongatus]